MKATNESLKHAGRWYAIRTAADFKQVPKERLGNCLEDFQQWLLFFDWDQHRAMFRRKHPILSLFRTPYMPVFLWMDMGRPSHNPLYR